MSAFSKSQKVAFEKVLEGFQDALVLSRNIAVYNTNSQELERENSTIYRPVPYISRVFSGTDMTSNFQAYTQLTVPAQLNIIKSVPVRMTRLELNDPQQEERITQAAAQALASDINIAVTNVATNQGGLVIKRTTAATGFDDIAIIDSLLNESGVPMDNRNVAFSSSNYNNIAKDLASRSVLQAGKTLTAYEKAYVGNVSGFDTFKLDYANNLTAAAATGVTVNGANQRYVPAAVTTAANGIGVTNVDNRYQNINVTVTSGTIKVGDCISFTGVNWVHRITKNDTGIPSTHRVTAIVSGAGGTGTIQISPPLIAADSSPTVAEQQYKNVTVTPANGSAITFLNTVTAKANPIWVRDAIELLPGRYNLASLKNSGAEFMAATTDNGVMILCQKAYNTLTAEVNLRFDTFYGVNMTLPEHAGIILFSQT